MEALRELESREDIIIRPADKGGAVVVMSLDKYDLGIKSQLTNTDHYVPLSSNPINNIKTMIDSFIDVSHKIGYLTDKEKSFLSKDSALCFMVCPKCISL